MNRIPPSPPQPPGTRTVTRYSTRALFNSSGNFKITTVPLMFTIPKIVIRELVVDIFTFVICGFGYAQGLGPTDRTWNLRFRHVCYILHARTGLFRRSGFNETWPPSGNSSGGFCLVRIAPGNGRIISQYQILGMEIFNWVREIHESETCVSQITKFFCINWPVWRYLRLRVCHGMHGQLRMWILLFSMFGMNIHGVK